MWGQDGRWGLGAGSRKGPRSLPYLQEAPWEAGGLGFLLPTSGEETRAVHPWRHHRLPALSLFPFPWPRPNPVATLHPPTHAHTYLPQPLTQPFITLGELQPAVMDGKGLLAMSLEEKALYNQSFRPDQSFLDFLAIPWAPCKSPLGLYGPRAPWPDRLDHSQAGSHGGPCSLSCQLPSTVPAAAGAFWEDTSQL